MAKIITWLDLEGRYRITSPGYNDQAAPPGETDDQLIQRVIGLLIQHYELPDTHTFHLVEGTDMQARITECCGHDFRWPVFGDAEGKRDGKLGAWEMDTDGWPKVNMAKARGIQMDYIRRVRNKELAAKDITFMRAVEAGNTDAQAKIGTEKQALRNIPQMFDLTTDTPLQLKAKWPEGLPKG